jgi:dihydroneopterin aldolase
MSLTLTIELQKARFFAYHGVGNNERKIGNEFEVNLSLSYSLSDGDKVTDDLADTISYADVYEVVKCEMDSPANLIEHVAYRILEALRGRWPSIERAKVQISKVAPPIPSSQCLANVAIEYIR